ncbi:MAG: hypothetical protein ACK4TI_03755 [Nitrososphaerales archaeon]
MNSYKIWVNFNEFMVFHNEVENKTIITKARKRGNDVYNWWFKRRYISLLKAFSKEEVYFNFYDEKERHIKSPIIFATLTFKHDDFMETGKEVGRRFNRFMSKIRKRMKNIYILARSWQCHKDGWIHIHAILTLDTWLYDRKRWFSGFRHKSKKDGRISYRLSKHIVEWFKKQWVYGFSDFQLCDSLKGALTYLSKYIFQGKETRVEAEIDIRTLTNAVCWIFRLRSFSFNYQKAYSLYANLHTLKARLDSAMHNSNWVLIGFVDESSPVVPLNGCFEVLDGYPGFLCV